MSRSAGTLLRLLAAVVLGLCLSISARPAAAQSPGGAAQVKEHVHEILSQREFRAENSDDPMARLGRAAREQWTRAIQWVQARWKSFVDWLQSQFRGFGGAGLAASAAATVVAKIFVVLFLGAAAWLVAWLIRRYATGRERRAARARTAYLEAEEDDGLVQEPGAWLDQAGEYATGQDYRRAFRAVFVAMLLEMDRAGLIEFDRSRTNGDYIRLLRRKSARRLVELFDPLVLEFDRRWYGRAETSRADFERIKESYDRLKSLAQEPAAPPDGALAGGNA